MPIFTGTLPTVNQCLTARTASWIGSGFAGARGGTARDGSGWLAGLAGLADRVGAGTGESRSVTGCAIPGAVRDVPVSGDAAGAAIAVDA